jgi:hypothetical protein
LYGSNCILSEIKGEFNLCYILGLVSNEVE